MGKNYYAATFVSLDRPGIVAEVAKVLYENGFNIEDSSSTLLRGFFSMILIISHENLFTPDEIKSMFLNSSKKLGLSISVKYVESLQEPLKNGKTFVISIYGSDKPGIVYKVTKFLADNNINIVDLQTKVAGKKDKPLYVMVLEINLSEDCDETWISSLKAISDELGTDINIRQIETYEF
jgi:glycine cleavage system transcriptional repressor